MEKIGAIEAFRHWQSDNAKIKEIISLHAKDGEISPVTQRAYDRRSQEFKDFVELMKIPVIGRAAKSHRPGLVNTILAMENGNIRSTIYQKAVTLDQLVKEIARYCERKDRELAPPFIRGKNDAEE